MKRMLCAAILPLLLASLALPASADRPRNVIFMIGDGMGFEQVRAAGMYAHGAPGTLAIESFPHSGQVTTYSANSSITDSAAAATAMATGYKVNNDVISRAIPGDNHALQTLLEEATLRGQRTGLVTTTYMTHATPAAFGAHEVSRENYSRIAGDYLNQTRPNVLFGGGANGMSPATATAAGYTVVSNRVQMQALDASSATLVSGQFGDTHLPYEYDFATGADSGYNSLPHLREMTGAALDILDDDPDGFFLMVEGGRIDHAGHENNLRRNIHETLHFDQTVQAVLDWAQGREDTLIVVTADHETGGLHVTQNNGAGNYPSVTWSTTDHTGVNVPVYAWGRNAELFTGVLDNTDLHDLVLTPEPSSIAGIAVLLLLQARRR